MRSLDILTEYVNKHGQSRVIEVCNCAHNTVSTWKKREGMTPAATIKLGLELGYDLEILMKIALVEAERTEGGKDFLYHLAGNLVSRRPKNDYWRKGGDSNPR